jgi:YHS domain-containing protein
MLVFRDKGRSTKISEQGKTACRGKLKDTDGFPSATYHDEQIYFCSQACLWLFTQSPDDFMAGKIEHPLGQD